MNLGETNAGVSLLLSEAAELEIQTALEGFSGKIVEASLSTPDAINAQTDVLVEAQEATNGYLNALVLEIQALKAQNEETSANLASLAAKVA